MSSCQSLLLREQATRGGRVKLGGIMAPETDYNHETKGDALHSMEIALALVSSLTYSCQHAFGELCCWQRPLHRDCLSDTS